WANLIKPDGKRQRNQQPPDQSENVGTKINLRLATAAQKSQKAQPGSQNGRMPLGERSLPWFDLPILLRFQPDNALRQWTARKMVASSFFVQILCWLYCPANRILLSAQTI
ncbi:hypothetical protein LJC48_07065, partial [Desulfovibrio sp. OttesenSCG-928-C06]|nr:hypothetical protein [Desulfovibrio sp. OttesenSCG-928-C06]